MMPSLHEVKQEKLELEKNAKNIELKMIHEQLRCFLETPFSIWVVLKFINRYDQEGGYFVGVFRYVEPTSPNGHWGRLNNEDVWYTKNLIDIGKYYDENDKIHTPLPV